MSESCSSPANVYTLQKYRKANLHKFRIEIKQRFDCWRFHNTEPNYNLSQNKCTWSVVLLLNNKISHLTEMYDHSCAKETWNKFLFPSGVSPLETSVESSLGLCWPWSVKEAACNRSKASAVQTQSTHRLWNSCNSARFLLNRTKW